MFKLYPRWSKVGHLPTVHSKCQASKLLACFWGAGCTAQKIIVLFPPHGYVPFLLLVTSTFHDHIDLYTPHFSEFLIRFLSRMHASCSLYTTWYNDLIPFFFPISAPYSWGIWLTQFLYFWLTNQPAIYHDLRSNYITMASLFAWHDCNNTDSFGLPCFIWVHCITTSTALWWSNI